MKARSERYGLSDRMSRCRSERKVSDGMLKIDETKTARNARVKASMRDHLRSKSWVEKVESIQRMNREQKIARAARKKALDAEAASKASKA
jgi:hypothetical protein